MNDFSLRRADNGGWVLSVGGNDGSFLPFHAFSSTEDLLKALPEILEKKQQTSAPKQYGAGEVQYLAK